MLRNPFGEEGSWTWGKFTAGDATTNVKFLMSGNSLVVDGMPKNNDPANTRAQKEHFKDAATRRAEGSNLHLSVTHRFNDDRVHASWVRAAYLAIFAIIGWNYTLNSVVSEIREQLSNKEPVLPRLAYYDTDSVPDQERILSPDNPAEAIGILVMVFRRNVVFMPGLHEAGTLAEFGQKVAGLMNSELSDLSGKYAEWPTGPRHLGDQPKFSAESSAES